MNSNETPEMSIHDSATSEIRERLFSKLNEEQRKVLPRIKNLVIEQKKGLEYETHGDERIDDTVEGEVEIEGINRQIMLFKITTKGGVVYGASLDGRGLNAIDAEKLFKFYYPIADILREDKHFPTERSDELVLSKEIDSLLGKN